MSFNENFHKYNFVYMFFKNVTSLSYLFLTEKILQKNYMELFNMRNLLLKILLKIFRKVLFSILGNYELSDFQIILIVVIVEVIIYAVKRNMKK